jgi:hypothetical protein
MVTSEAAAGWQQLSFPEPLVVDRDGYVQVFVANESDVEVWFDEVEVAHTPGLVVQENRYPPFGLNLVGLEQQGQPDFKFQFNGKERQEVPRPKMGLHLVSRPAGQRTTPDCCGGTHGIGNGLHWQLDVTFGEGQSRKDHEPRT